MPEISDAELNRLKNAVGELSTLNQIASAVNVTMSVDKITSTIVDHCRRRVKAAQGAIFLLEDEDQEMDRFKTFVREVEPADGAVPFHLNQSLQGWMVKHKTILKSNDPDSDDRLRGVNFKAIGLQSLVAAPLLSRSGLIGLLIVFNKEEEEGFSDNDARFLGIVGTQVSKVIENAKLFEKEQRLAEMEKEMKIAQSIQAGFLPKENISADGFEAIGFNVPAKEVGGDYYDLIRLDKNRAFLSLGDISGKGLPAALVMSNAQAVLRSQLQSNTELDLVSLGKCLNRLIYEFTAPEQYITAVFGIYDHNKRIFQYVNAGHLPPMIVRADGRIEQPDGADLIVGILPEVEFSVLEVPLGPGDAVALYTDGITEANNDNTEMYGEERLEECMKACAGMPSNEISTRLKESVDEFRGGAAQSDDITLLLLKVS